MTSSPGLKNHAEALVKRVAVLGDDVSTRVAVFARTPAGGFDGFRLNATVTLIDQFRSVAREHVTALVDAPLVPYRAGRRPDPHEAVFLDPATVPTLPSIMEKLARGATALDVFDHDSAEASRTRFSVITLGTLADSVHFLRAMSARSRLGRKKIAALASNGVYTSLEQDPVLFDTKVDAVVGDEVVVVANQREFERTVDFVTEARAAAATTIEQATVHLAIANRDAFIDAASNDINMIAKLRGIAEKIESDPRYAAAMTMDKVLGFIGDHPNLDIETAEVDGVVHLVYHSDPQRRYQILKLLDDDYLHSTITAFDYEANSKSLLG